jgi:transcriptional regulator with XRE-family HTH domain
MLDNQLIPYESWEITQPLIPSRSRLYQLEPVGIGTPLVESLTGYISRLAQAHSVLPGVLMERELVPFVKKTNKNDSSEYLTSRAGVFSRTATLNSMGYMAANWVEALETLTLRQDIRFLTMLTWANIFPSRGLMRSKWAYCPSCYEEWHSSDQVIYEPLLWAINQVKVCLRHHCFLQFRCFRCSQTLSPLGWNSRPGYCSKCKTWLGIFSDVNLSNNKTLNEKEWQIQKWIIQAIGELIAAAPRLPFSPDEKIIAKAFSNYITKLSQGNIAAFARLLNIPKNTVWMWCNGKALPSMDIIVKIYPKLGISLLDSLNLDFNNIDYGYINKLPQTQQSVNRTVKSRKSFNTQRIQHALEESLKSEQCPPPSMIEVGRLLEYDPSFLRKHFSDLCRAISARYTNYQETCYKQKIEQLCLEVKQAAIALHAQGLYPSNTRVSLYLKQPGAIRNRDVRAALEQIRCQLGVGKNQADMDR